MLQPLQQIVEAFQFVNAHTENYILFNRFCPTQRFSPAHPYRTGLLHGRIPIKPPRFSASLKKTASNYSVLPSMADRIRILRESKPVLVSISQEAVKHLAEAA